MCHIDACLLNAGMFHLEKLSQFPGRLELSLTLLLRAPNLSELWMIQDVLNLLAGFLAAIVYTILEDGFEALRKVRQSPVLSICIT